MRLVRSAFSADVIAPGPLTITLPSTIARTAPLTITWAVASAESLQLSIVGSAGAGIRCIVPAEDGTQISNGGITRPSHRTEGRRPAAPRARDERVERAHAALAV